MRLIDVGTSKSEPAILTRRRKLNEIISDEVPPVFNTNRWIGSVINWRMRHEHFEAQILLFINTLPYLNTEESLFGHTEL